MYKKQHVHFVGIGGIGMSGLARVLLTLGHSVSGSDLRQTELTRALERMGAVVYRGHAPEHVLGADVVVISSAVRADNPEVEAARVAQIPVIPRAEMLAGLMRLKKFGIAVAGAHGKTSTTSLVAAVLREGGLDPTVIIGGKVNGIGGNACWGRGDYLVAEADESDGSFLRLTPSIAVVTNIDREHLDHYRDLDHIRRSFAEFLDRLPFYGLAVLCADDPHVADLLPGGDRRVITYGTSEAADLRARDIRHEAGGVAFSAWWQEAELGSIRLRKPGLHNVRNALAALAVGIELEIPFEVIRQGLHGFTGVGRRFEHVGEVRGITVMDDYAHHPTEIRATLEAARACWPDRRLVVLFEPHRYTRTHALMDEFAGAFTGADLLFLTEIYPASEEPIVGVSGERLARRVRERHAGEVQFVPSCEALAEAAATRLRPGDVVFTLGAGGIGAVGQRLVEILGGKAQAAVP
ncbi:UDP-N-acetylmuramate--L-alanine ligase [Dissulfurirhabdus thermomarina]|uniref:UDP-N-acetylmuramate--L-alanine ligase n=1 Tax=Dissulfurirhabdus thermomarina TaxID=1765737 RepID=A0A6N9TSH0_DISTH|nr:UDP-N-acetylmuramate--L-alanine ligase [Dissulfurirhabdus thermomarina]NDY43350.1 UDP-N-acetylmuramate--L-alanine ligase [Dissulfurirhabdus thermomarina]NMX24231.1 UDP-N-acetylmuramate--L-alanine ligase [Dissulfurirhabdus thermomarina]